MLPIPPPQLLQLTPARRLRPRGLTIRGKILGAFLVITAIFAAVGVYAVTSVRETGRLVVDTFDRPLMAINHARLAKAGFVELQLAVQRAGSRGPGLPLEQDPGIVAQRTDLEQDIDIAARRSVSADGVRTAAELRHLVNQWWAAMATTAREPAPDWSAADALARRIERRFEVLINIAAGDAFRWRQDAIATVNRNEISQGFAIAVSIVLAIVITLFLARQILRPIQTASAAAERIAGGELETSIPDPRRNDETGALLDAMSVMQDNLRAMMAREVAARRSAQRRMSDAIENSHEGVLLIGGDGRILVANTQARRMFVEAAGCLAPGEAFAAFEWRIVEEALVKLHPGQSVPMSTEGEIELRDGRWIRVSRSSAADGGFVLIWSDITLLKEREATLRTAKEQAEAANKAKTRFLANMSHELRTPLNAVIGFSEMIAHAVSGPIGSPKYKSYAEDILRSGQHVVAIINDILDIAKSEAGTLQIRPIELAVARLFGDCEIMMRMEAQRAGLKFTIEPPEPSLSVFVDAAKGRQVLLNLLSNAIKFTRPGGRVTLSATASSTAAVDVFVADTGIGMRAADIPVALAPFEQVDSRLERKFEGTGLGLPLARKLAELQGGALELRSEIGVGTTVRVRFPRSAVDTAPARRAGHATGDAGQTV